MVGIDKIDLLFDEAQRHFEILSNVHSAIRFVQSKVNRLRSRALVMGCRILLEDNHESRATRQL